MAQRPASGKSVPEREPDSTALTLPIRLSTAAPARGTGRARPRSRNPPLPETSIIIAFALVSLGMVLTPGPNMIYLVSRSIAQGPVAGLVSLGGVAIGFVFYMLCAAFGITALLPAVPFAYDALRGASAAYLLFLAWRAVRPGGRAFALFLTTRPGWANLQRGLMGTVLAAPAVRMATEARR